MSGVVVASTSVGGGSGIAGAAVLGAAAVAVVAVAAPIVIARAAVLVGSEIHSQWQEIAEREKKATRARREAIAAAIARQESIVMVMETNAAIAVLAAAAKRYQPRVETPAPLTVDQQSDEQLRAWCAQTADTLRDRELQIATLAGKAHGQHLLLMLQVRGDGPSGLPGGGWQPYTPDPAVAEHFTRGPAANYVAGPELVAEVARVVGRLDMLASSRDIARVHEAAAALPATRTADDARNAVTEVRVRVQEANAQASLQRKDALEAARMLQALADQEGAEADDARTALQSVVAGESRLDSRLRSRAIRVIEQASERDARDYYRQQLLAAVAELGYDLQGGFETMAVGKESAFLVKASWRQHAVQVVIDHDAHQLRAAVVRTAEAVTGEDRRLDAEHERQWCDGYAAVTARLAEAGIEVEHTLVVEPGTHELPVVQVGKRPSYLSDGDRAAQQLARQQPKREAS